MNWYYESGGQQQGPVADSELDRLLAEGKITLDTLVWREGMAGWTPLRTARPSAPPPVANIEDSDPGWEVTRPGTPVAPALSGAQGSEAPQPGWVRCSLTGKYFPPSEIIYLDGKPYSAAAKPQVVASMQTGVALPDLSGERNGPAWEQRATLGTWKAMVETVKALMAQPTNTFATMKPDGGLNSPLLFWLLTAGVGVAIGQVYGVLMQGAMAGVMTSAGVPNNQVASTMGMQAVIGAGSIVVVPIFLIISLFIQAGLTHLTLMMLKGANRPFEATFRVVAYAFGATGTLHLIPICGSSVAGIWGLILLCMGLGPVQGTTTGKGVAAVLIPFAVCCLAVGAIYAVVFGAIFAAAAGNAGK